MGGGDRLDDGHSQAVSPGLAAMAAAFCAYETLEEAGHRISPNQWSGVGNRKRDPAVGAVNSRNGYRLGSATPGPERSSWRSAKLRSGSYFPDWLLQHRRRAEQALVSVVATSYLSGVSTRRVEKPVEQLGVKQLSKSQVSEMASHLDAHVEAFRNRPLDAAHYTFVWVDTLVIKVREHGRAVNVHALVAVAVNADAGREGLGLDVCSDEDGASWLALPRSLTARGLSGRQAGHFRRPPRPGLGDRRCAARPGSGAAPIGGLYHERVSGLICRI
jgi:hypothetical protein